MSGRGRRGRRGRGGGAGDDEVDIFLSDVLAELLTEGDEDSEQSI